MTNGPDTKTWQEFLGTSSSTLALPDYKSNYFAYGFDWKKNQNLGLKITGEFGYARYMSYNIYAALDGTSKDSLLDVAIEPLPGNVNPFRAGCPSHAPNRKYTVNVFCWDNASPTTQALPNQLTFTNIPNQVGDQMTMLVVILRYYLPTDGDPTADVPLPIIEAFDTERNVSAQRPPNLVPKTMPMSLYAETLAPIFYTIVDDTLRFYHVAGGGQFNNADNLYLMNAVDKRADEVLILKFQPPTYALVNDRYPDVQVRYWSFNEGTPETITPAGRADEGFRMAKDGLIYIAFGDQSQTLADWAKKGGYNFMPWAVSPGKAVILYRNLVTNPTLFEAGNIAQVPVLLDITSNTDPRIYTFDAKNTIGSYAPTGKKVTEAEFMKNYGGMPSPGFKA